MYKHTIKKIKIKLIFSDLKKKLEKDDNAILFFIDKPQNNFIKKVQIKRSFLFKSLDNVFLSTKGLTGSNSIFKVIINPNKDLETFLEILEKNPCSIIYESKHYTHNKILSLLLKTNDLTKLVGLIINQLIRVLLFFLPLKKVLFSIKNKKFT